MYEATINELAPLPKRSRVDNAKNAAKWVKRNIINPFTEGATGASVGYASYLIIVADPLNQSRYGYILVVGAGLAGATLGILNITKVISDQNYRKYHETLEALSGSTVATLYLQGLLEPNNATVGIGIATTFVLTTSKSLLNFYQNSTFLQNRTGKYLVRHPAEIIYNFLAGVGVASSLSELLVGLGATIPVKTYRGLNIGMGFGSVLANLPIAQHNGGENPQSIFFTPGAFIRALMFAIAIGSFLPTLLFDVETDIENSTDLKDSVFYTILIYSLVQAFLVGANKYHDDVNPPARVEIEATEKTKLLDSSPSSTRSSLFVDGSLNRSSYWKDESRSTETYERDRELQDGIVSEEGLTDDNNNNVGPSKLDL